MTVVVSVFPTLFTSDGLVNGSSRRGVYDRVKIEESRERDGIGFITIIRFPFYSDCA